MCLLAYIMFHAGGHTHTHIPVVDGVVGVEENFSASSPVCILAGRRERERKQKGGRIRSLTMAMGGRESMRAKYIDIGWDITTATNYSILSA